LLNRYYIKKDTPLQRRDVGLAAEGADCAGMDRCAAIRARPLQKLAAHRAILTAYGIGRLAVGKIKPNLLDEILLVRRAVGIRAETVVKWGSWKVGEWGSVDLCGRDRRCERKIELLRQLLDNLVVQLRSIALLEHRKRRLLATDFGRKLPLSQPSLTASELYVFAELWIQVFQSGDIMDFILSTIKGSNINIINNNINNVHNAVDIVD